MKIATFYLDKVLLKNTNLPKYGEENVRKYIVLSSGVSITQ